MSNYWATREVMTFDVDKFIADVCKKYEQMAQENPALAAWAKTEEELRKLWDAVLNVRRPGGDASLYPNQHGPQPALMEVWHKAGDFWRAKYRLGDTLLCDQNGAALSPAELGWIAKAKASSDTENEAFLYDSNHATEGGLLPTENNLQANTEDATPAAAGDTNTETNITTDQGAASSDARQPIFENDEPKDIEAVGNQSTTDPISNTTPTYHSGDDPEPTALPKPKRQRRKKAAETKPQQLSLFDQELQQEQEEPAANKLMRGAGYLAAASVTIILVWQTGLIIPLGLIGLATSGLLK